MNIYVGQVIDDDFIEKATEYVTQDGYQEFNMRLSSEFTCNLDHDGSFKESLEYAEKSHFQIWERDHEYEEVLSKVEGAITYYLEEHGILNSWKNKDPLSHEYYESFADPIITESNKADVQQALCDAGFEVAWMISESLQLYFQTTNPCEWDGKPPKQRYGDDWVADTQTRLILMLHKDSIPKDIYNRLTRKTINPQFANANMGGYYENRYNGDYEYFQLER